VTVSSGCSTSVDVATIDILCLSGESKQKLSVAFPSFFFDPTGSGMAVFVLGVIFLGIVCYAIWWIVNGGDDQEASIDFLPTEFTRLLIGEVDPRQVLLYLAASERINLAVWVRQDGIMVSRPNRGSYIKVTDILPAEQDHGPYDWFMFELRMIFLGKSMLRIWEVADALSKIKPAIKKAATRALRRRKLIWRWLGLWRIFVFLVFFVLPACFGLIIEHVFLPHVWLDAGLFVVLVFPITMIVWLFLWLYDGMRYRKKWWYLLLLMWIVNVLGVGGLYSGKACSWDALSAAIWAALADAMFILGQFLMLGLTLEGIREARRCGKYVDVLQKDLSETGIRPLRSLSYLGKWFCPENAHRLPCYPYIEWLEWYPLKLTPLD
jgi:hypothetical protein